MSNAYYPMKLTDFFMKYDKTEILLKVALNIIHQPKYLRYVHMKLEPSLSLRFFHLCIKFQ
jgi:hypothetical protein